MGGVTGTGHRPAVHHDAKVTVADAKPDAAKAKPGATGAKPGSASGKNTSWADACRGSSPTL